MKVHEHIHPEFVHTLQFDKAERISFLSAPRWIGYGVALRVLDLLERLASTPSRPRMPNLLVVGDPNNGKTTVVRHFMESSPTRGPDAEFRSAILAEAPPSADEKGLYVSLLEQLKAPYRISDPCSALRYQVIHLFRRCGTRIVLIDEFHSLLTGSAIKQREVMNAIKLLCNELAIPIIGIGTRDAVRVLHSDPQHASRFDVIGLPRWSPDREFQTLLASFEAVLPLQKPSKLATPEMALTLHTISDGNIGNLHRLLIACAEDAIREGTECISKEIVESKRWMRPTAGIREIL